jgi:hypothetical protein
VALVDVRNVVGLLDGGSGEVARRNKPASQQRLLILSVEQQQLHQQTLNGLEQLFHFGTGRAFLGGNPQPYFPPLA